MSPKKLFHINFHHCYVFVAGQKEVKKNFYTNQPPPPTGALSPKKREKMKVMSEKKCYHFKLKLTAAIVIYYGQKHTFFSTLGIYFSFGTTKKRQRKIVSGCFESLSRSKFFSFIHFGNSSSSASLTFVIYHVSLCVCVI